jgi:rhodanese-related sulfurtransferase
MGDLYRTWGLNRCFYHLLSICLLVIITSNRTISASESKEIPSEFTAKRKSSSRYCGIYCLYTVMKLNDLKTNFRELVKPEYIGSRKGSSLAELKKAAEDYGLYAVPVNKLSSRLLKNCSHLVILHVKAELTSDEYNHYELFLGSEDGKAKLFDPPEPVKLVPYHELTPRWNGNGLIVSIKPIDLSVFLNHTRKRFILYVAITIAVILTLHWVKLLIPEKTQNTRIRLMSLSITQSTGFAITALLCGMIYHFVNDTGMLANAKATSAIQQAHAGNFIPKVSERKVHKLLNDDTIFIDARFSRDYKAGHIEGAISLPVDANDIELQRATSNIAKDARIVTYCQSAGCKFAEKVAIKLIDDGFSNISIYKGGWAEWVAKNGKKKDATS